MKSSVELSKKNITSLTKQITQLEARMRKQSAILKGFQDIENIDARQRITQANQSMKEIVDVEKKLRNLTAAAQKEIGALPKDQRKGAAKDFNKRLDLLDRKALIPCVKIAQNVTKVSRKALKEKLPDIDAGVFTAPLELGLFLSDVFQKVIKKRLT